ncbi:MAG: YajQ family cyclic di-GMP-binding protein [Gemmatimonadaceae bacterium]
MVQAIPTIGVTKKRLHPDPATRRTCSRAYSDDLAAISFHGMADNYSFDVTTGVDLQEVDNAVNQAQKEIAQRYDFKGSRAAIEFARAEGKLKLVADDDFKMRALFDVLQTKLIKRGVPVKNLDAGETIAAGGDTVRKEIGLKMALDSDTAKKVSAAIKEARLKKVQAAIQGDQVRVSSPSKDDLQGAMALLRLKDFGVELKFGNYR